MFAPWRKLKKAEISVLAKRRAGEAISEPQWIRLERLFDRCKHAPDADQAICFHGVAALLAERNGEFQLALKHRIIEIDKIVWLHEEEKRNPTDGYQTQNYEMPELDYRREIVREIQARMQ